MDSKTFQDQRLQLAAHLESTQQQRRAAITEMRETKYLPPEDWLALNQKVRRLWEEETETLQQLRELKRSSMDEAVELRNAIVRTAERFVDTDSDEDYDKLVALVEKHRPYRKVNV